MIAITKFVIGADSAITMYARSHGAWTAVTLAANQALTLDASTGAITLTTTYSDAIRTQVFTATASTTDHPTYYSLASQSLADLSGHAITGKVAGDCDGDGSADDTLAGGARADHLAGGRGNDHLAGNAGADVLSGGDGNDILLGGAGADVLKGGAGDDVLTGGAGRDVLVGGAGADRFVFADGDSGTGKATDRIVDFSHAQGDAIDLSAIDANVTLAGDQAFAFIGTAAFSHTAGELRLAVSHGSAKLMADTNGDGVADMAIALDHVTSLVAADLVL